MIRATAKIHSQLKRSHSDNDNVFIPIMSILAKKSNWTTTAGASHLTTAVASHLTTGKKCAYSRALLYTTTTTTLQLNISYYDY